MSGASSPAKIHPRAELLQSLGWMAGGLAILIASVRMDRLESQNINPYTVPGLLPGLLGLLMFVLGAMLFVRSWRRGGLHRDAGHVPTSRAEKVRIAIVIALCVFFDVVLVGHGLPFWAAAWIFVTGSILVLQYPLRRAAGERPTLTWVAKALAIGLGAGLMITLVFQELFLVRLP
jgi:hypothetical protein